MLHALELENFKAFGKRARIPFAPITLIFGENSAGKSSILHALYLLKQTIESKESGALLLPRTENGIVDLGSFQEMLFDHDLERTLSIRVETKMDSELGIEFRFKRPSLEKEILLDQIGIYDGKSAKCIAKFQPSDTTTVEPHRFWTIGALRKPRIFSPSKLTESKMKCVWFTEENAYFKREFEWCKKNREVILNQFKQTLVDLQHTIDERQGDDKGLQEELNSLRDGIDFFSSNFDFETYICKRRDEEMNAVLGMQGFLPVAFMRERIAWITELRNLLRWESDIFDFDIAELTMVGSVTLEQTLDYLFPMSPFRRPPQRWYIFSGTGPEDVGYQGDLLPDLLFRRPELVEETDKWLKKLDMGYELDVKSVRENSGDLFEVRLVDTRRKKPVNVALPDVGFGISQLLPFIVQSLLAENQIISIEQPEVHVHPKLQADLGDLLAKCIKEPRQNQFIVETHSEHLILRLQRLVYKGEIKPEDVSVIYVSRGPEGAKAQRLHLDDEGDFIDEWPNGFFLERLRELR